MADMNIWPSVWYAVHLTCVHILVNLSFFCKHLCCFVTLIRCCSTKTHTISTSFPLNFFTALFLVENVSSSYKSALMFTSSTKSMTLRWSRTLISEPLSYLSLVQKFHISHPLPEFYGRLFPPQNFFLKVIATSHNSDFLTIHTTHNLKFLKRLHCKK